MRRAFSGHNIGGMTRFCTLLFLVCGLGCRHAPHREMPLTSDPELQRLEAALNVAMTQYEMNLASHEIAKYWDAKLASIEKRVERKLGTRFAESKARWRSYRMQEVQFRSDGFAGGSIQPLIANLAYAELTEHRVAELLSLLGEVQGLEDQP